MNPERAAKIAAKRIGCSVVEYQERRGNGEKWCSGCRSWVSVAAFSVDRARSDGLASKCRDCNATYMQSYLRENRCLDCGVASMGQRCADCYQVRAERRAKEKADLRPYRRLVWAVYTAARLEREAIRQWRLAARRVFGGIARVARDSVREARRLAAAVAVAARLEQRQWLREARRLAAAVAVAARLAKRERLTREREAMLAARRAQVEQKRAVKRARWNPPRRREALTPISLDKDLGEDFNNSLTFGDCVARVEDDTAYIYDQAELAATLRRIAGDIGPEDIQRMDAWTLQRLQARLLAEGITPSRPQKSELERLREPNRHAGASVPKTGRKGGGKRTRAQQQQVTREHHVRDLTNTAKRQHKQLRAVRQEPA